VSEDDWPEPENISEATRLAKRLFDSISAKFGRAEAKRVWSDVAKGKPGRPPKTQLSEEESWILFLYDASSHDHLNPEAAPGLFVQWCVDHGPDFLKVENKQFKSLVKRLKTQAAKLESDELVRDSWRDGVPVYRVSSAKRRRGK
jgi:hypothetical protein